MVMDFAKKLRLLKIFICTWILFPHGPDRLNSSRAGFAYVIFCFPLYLFDLRDRQILEGMHWVGNILEFAFFY